MAFLDMSDLGGICTECPNFQVFFSALDRVSRVSAWLHLSGQVFWARYLVIWIYSLSNVLFDWQHQWWVTAAGRSETHHEGLVSARPRETEARI